MTNKTLRLFTFAVPVVLAGCVSLPGGPSVASFPGTGKNFEQFRTDETNCRLYASASIGGTEPTQAQTESAVKSAAIGTAIGAVAGAAFGGHWNTGFGAGTGLLFGALAGSASANQSGYAMQKRYDNAFLQCMYAKGNKVPIDETAVQMPPPVYLAPAPAILYGPLSRADRDAVSPT